MMKKLNLVIAILTLVSITANAVQQRPQTHNGVDGTIILGQHYSFILKEPTGWVIDASSGRSQGIDAVLYREGSSWRNGTAVMYARVTYKNSVDAETIDRIIQNDVSHFKKLSSLSQVSDEPSLSTRDRKKAVVKNFYDAENRNYESVAYIDEPKVVVFLVLSSRTREDFDNSLPAFRDLVSSYFFVTELADPQ